MKTQLTKSPKSAPAFRIVLILIVTIGYVVIFFPLYEMTGGGVGGALAIVPVILAGWYWGIRGGLISAVLLSLLAAYLIDLTREGDGATIVRSFLGPGTWALLLMGTVVGYLRDLRGKLKDQILERWKAEQKISLYASQLEENERFSLDVISSLESHIAVLNKQGVIVAVNEAWNEFARQNGDPELINTGLGVNYLDICQEAVDRGESDAAQVLKGLKEILDGQLPKIELEYPCHSPDEERWFQLSATPMSGDSGGVAVAHVNITSRKKAEKALEEKAFELQRSNEMIAALSLTTAGLRAHQSVDEILELMGSNLEEMGLHCVFAREAQGDQKLEVAYTSLQSGIIQSAEKLTGIKAHGFILPRKRLPIYDEVVKKKKPVYVADSFEVGIKSFPVSLPRLLLEKVMGMMDVSPQTSAIWLPLISEGKNLGVLWMWGKSIQEADMPAAELFAGQVATALDTAHAFETERWLRKNAEALRESAAALTSTLDFDRLLDRILENIGKVVPYAAANIMQLDEKKEKVSVIASHNYAKFGADIQGLTFPISRAHGFQTMIETGQPVIINDTSNHPDWYKRKDNRWIRSYAGAPLILGGDVIGYLNLDSPITDSFDEDQIQPLMAFADQAAIAFENARLFESERQQSALSDVLRIISEDISSSLDIDTVMQRVLQNVGRVVPHDTANVMLIEKQFARVTHSTGYTPNQQQKLLEIRLSIKTTPTLMEMIETKCPLLINDTNCCSEWVQTFVMDSIGSYIATPLVIQNIVVGFLNLNAIAPNTYHDEHVEPLQIFGNQVAVAIENAQLYGQTDAQLKESIQLLEEQADSLRKALQTRTSFLQQMSHELRTPLNAIIGFSEMLKSETFGTLAEKQVRYADNIHQSGNRLLGLVNNVLDITEIESGGVTPAPQKMLMTDLFTSLIQSVAEQTNKKNIQISQEISDPSLMVHADPEQFLRVLRILVDNAIKFNQDGGKVILSAMQENDQIQINITDMGIGIKEDDFSRIFSQFEQADEDSLSRSHEGAGLSLSLAKALVELNQGRIWVESDGVPGEGTTFYLAFPN